MTLSFVVAYALFMFFIRWSAGMFVYPYMNQMNTASVVIYCVSTMFSSIALYESGFFINGIFHIKRERRSID